MQKILVAGAVGKMGLEIVKTILSDKNLKLVGVLGNKTGLGEDIGKLTLGKEIGLLVRNDFDNLLEECKPDIVLDVTNAEPSYNIILKALERNINCITGTTGFSQKQLDKIKELTEKNNLTTIIAPNFSIGAVLMMKFSENAAKYFDNVEIIEMHHEKKKDSPSGTAIKTAEMISKNNKKFNENLPESEEKIAGVRGGCINNINIHSIRTPGFVATQEVIFGGLGQIFVIKHQTINREAYMPGVTFCIKRLPEIKGYIYGLENIL
ncbi:MAG: 4-hydroxy-tetrahydrodipicolinate reductase [Candidatus Sericytochromatia bacterium]